MKELIRHIEALLLENDCAILPNFGGFITHHSPARWIEEENIFLPPFRSVGFNSQLKINDGLLVQSYMQTHDATFPEATRLVDAAIDELTEVLYKEGEVEFYGIGILRRTVTGEYNFEPTENGVITPSLYGFSALDITPLSELKQSVEPAHKTAITITPQTVAEDFTNMNNKPEASPYFQPEVQLNTPKSSSHTVVIKIRREWLTNVISVAAAIILFFILSTPVDNTYIEEENYASLGSIDVFEQVRKKSVVTTLLSSPKAHEVIKTETPTQAHKVSETIKENTSKPENKNVAETIENIETPASTPKQTEDKAIASATVSKENVSVVSVNVSANKTTTSAVSASTAKKPAAVPQKERPKTTYNIIVASVTSANDAEQVIRELAAKGHTGAFSISSSGRFRIAISSFSNQTDAYHKINELKQTELFKDAWILTERK